MLFNWRYFERKSLLDQVKVNIYFKKHLNPFKDKNSHRFSKFYQENSIFTGLAEDSISVSESLEEEECRKTPSVVK